MAIFVIFCDASTCSKLIWICAMCHRQDFRNSKELDDLIARQAIIYANLRGTEPFWDRQTTRIHHMIAALGAQTAFATFSSAEYQLSRITAQPNIRIIF